MGRSFRPGFPGNERKDIGLCVSGDERGLEMEKTTKKSGPLEMLRRAGSWTATVCRGALTPDELAKHLVIMMAIELARWTLEHGWRFVEAACR
jgi:hypothetical protein